jgi:cation transport ATPase
MAEEVQRAVQTTTKLGDTINRTTEVTNDRDDSSHHQDVATRIVWYITGILLVLLAFRFVFALLGANTSNAFANFIFTLSHPFVAPFFSLFSYDQRYGVSHLEIYTLVAMAVYAVIGWGIARLVNLNRK